MSRWLITAEDNIEIKQNTPDISNNIDKKFMDQFKDGKIPSKGSSIWKDLLDLAFSRDEKDKGSFSSVVEFLKTFSHDLAAELLDSEEVNEPYYKYKVLKLDGNIIISSEKILFLNKNDITFTTSKGNTFYNESLELFNELSPQEKQWLCDGDYRDATNLILKSIAYYGDKLVGFCDAAPYKATSTDTVLLLVCVDKNFRGQGIASSLVRLIEEALHSTNYKKTILRSKIDNERSVDLAKQNSYNYVGMDKDDVLYIKEID